MPFHPGWMPASQLMRRPSCHTSPCGSHDPGCKLDRHQELAGLAVILVQAGFPLGVAGAVVAGHDPDISLVVERHVVKARPLLRAHADQDFGNPRLRIDTQDAAQAQGGNPELAVVPLHTMAATAPAVDAERNLTVADLLGVHVDLKDAVWVGVRAHPHAAVPVRHAGRIARMGLDRLEQLAVPIDQPRHLIAVRVQGQVIGRRILRSDLLLPDPQASGCVGHHGQRVGIQARRFEHPGRLRRSGRSRAASAAALRPRDLASHRLAAPAQSPSN